MKKFFENEMWKKLARALIVEIVFVAVMLPILLCNFDFACLCWERNEIAKAIYNGSMEVEALEEVYAQSVTTMELFAQKGDYQRWMVLSNNTDVGQYVLLIIILVELVAFVTGLYLVGCNAVAFCKLSYKIRGKEKIAQ